MRQSREMDVSWNDGQMALLCVSREDMQKWCCIEIWMTINYQDSDNLGTKARAKHASPKQHARKKNSKAQCGWIRDRQVSSSLPRILKVIVTVATGFFSFVYWVFFVICLFHFSSFFCFVSPVGGGNWTEVPWSSYWHHSLRVGPPKAI